MPILLAVLAALGGVAIWRRKKIGSDAQRVGDAARQTVQKMTSSRKDLMAELGSHVYAQSTGDTEVDHEAEIKRIIGELEALDATSDESSDAEEAAAV